MISRKLEPFGTTIFSEMTALAVQHGAINLAQGFPDFEGPSGILDAAEQAMRSGDNQYARSMGHPRLVQAIAAKVREDYSLSYDPLSEVVVFSGATEGIAASLLGLLNPGDEVILFEPFYDSYPVCVALAQATPRFLTLEFPRFTLDVARLESLFNEKTRLLLLNTPHNPSGKVFQRAELEAIARLCIQHDVWVVADEVYEHILFDGTQHLPIASLPGMRERTLTISSAGKTFSLTGWKVGWAVGPKPLVAAAQAAHQYLTFSTATPLQRAIAVALEKYRRDYFEVFQREYHERRDFLRGVLERIGFRVSSPQGAYFLLADFTPLFDGDDRTFARRLVEEHRVAAIPPSVFYRQSPEQGRRLLRFAFCKKMSTLEAAARNLEGLRR